MANFTAEDFKKVKAVITKELSNSVVAKKVGWSAETVRLVRKSRSFKAYKELSSR